MLRDWTVHALSGASRVGDWRDATDRLGGALQAVERFRAPDHLHWRVGGRPVRRDTDRADGALLDVVQQQRERHGDGSEVGGGASTGVVTAHLDDGAVVAEVSWDLGGAGAADDVRVRFLAEVAHGLDDQAPRSLVELLTQVGRAVNADRAQITTRALFRALGRREASLAVGALTLLPSGLPSGTSSPAGFAAVPAGPGYPAGAVLVADLHRVLDDPDTVADALAALDAVLADRGARPLR